MQRMLAALPPSSSTTFFFPARSFIDQPTSGLPVNDRSRVRGSVEPLANGNLLVTESIRGRVFELARDGSIVWEFHNPEPTEDGGTRRQIYRMLRVPPDA